MNRDQLLDRYTRLLQWINTTPVDESALSSLVAPDIVVPLPYPGATPDYAGLITTTTKVHESQAGWKMELVHATVDDVQCVVIGLLKVSGVHVGEWLGIPGTNKSYEIQGFMSTRTDPKTGLMVELSMIFQDLLFLQQIGIVQPPPS